MKIKYNPNNPDEIIWTDEEDESIMLFTIGSIVLLIIGVYIVFDSFSSTSRTEPTITYNYNNDNKGPNDHELYQRQLREKNQDNNQINN